MYFSSASANTLISFSTPCSINRNFSAFSDFCASKERCFLASAKVCASSADLRKAEPNSLSAGSACLAIVRPMAPIIPNSAVGLLAKKLARGPSTVLIKFPAVAAKLFKLAAN